MASAGAGKVWRDAGLEPVADYYEYQPTRVDQLRRRQPHGRFTALSCAH
jgi:hypothetical protein